MEHLDEQFWEVKMLKVKSKYKLPIDVHGLSMDEE